jgi:exopolysaccharide production protein ExoZ
MVRVGWTLIYEIFFYGLFAAAMAVSLRHRALITTAVLLSLTILYLILKPSIIKIFPLYVYGDPIVIQFALGMGTAYAVKHCSSIQISPKQFLIAIVLLTAVMHFGNGSSEMNGLLRLAQYGTPSAIIVLLGLLVRDQDSFSHPIIGLLGDSSYSIYLVHMLPLALMRWIWSAFAIPVDGFGWAVTFIAVSSTLAVIAGTLSYLLVERPAIKYLKSKLLGQIG